jgi:ribonuclease-3
MVKDAGTNERLQEVAKEWNLPALLQENPCQAGQEQRTTLASTVEALIGAVWIACNRNLAKMQDVVRLLQG